MKTSNRFNKSLAVRTQRVIFYSFLIVSYFATSWIQPATADTVVDNEGRKCVHEAIENKKFQEAFKQACKMADHDCGYSQCLLGIMYENGVGVKQNISTAVEWYQKAATKGIAEAQYRLGRLYYVGKEVKRDPKKAAEWFNKAAEQGVGQAQFYLGKMYLKGDGVPRELRKARRWLHLAADRGIADAKELIASSHLAKETIHQGKKVVRKVQDHATAGGRLYGQTLENTEMSWKGYADIVNALDKAAAGANNVNK